MRAGYKQTEMGMIPDDWNVENVSGAYEICNTLRLPISTKERGKIQGPYPYYGPTKIQDYINEFRVEGEYALIGEDGDHFLKYDSMPQTQLANGKFNVNNHAHLIKGIKNTTKWFYYFFRNRDISIYLTRQGAGRFKLNKSALGSLPCVLPQVPEQTIITSILSDMDELIVSLEKLIAKKRDIKTATMQQLLTGKKRLPGFGEGKGYKQTELGEIPEDWDVKPLGELLKIRHGKSQKDVIFLDGKYPILATGGEIGRSKFFLYSKPSVLIGRKGTIDIPYYMDTPFWTVDTLFYSEVADSAVAKFIYYKFLFVDWYQYNEASGVPSLNAATIEKIVQAVPSDKDEQLVISSVLTEFDTDINNLEKQLNKTKAIKQGMMQELLTGRIRLVDSTVTPK